MLDIKRLLNKTSLRGKFLVAPGIALLAMVILSALFISTLFELSNSQREMENNDIAIINRISGIAVDFSQLHAKLYDILLAAKDGADEERIYDAGKPLLEDFIKLEERFHAAQTASQQEGVDLELSELVKFDHLISDYGHYKEVAITAIEMATVNQDSAKERLINADEIYRNLILDMQGALKVTGKAISSDLSVQQQIMTRTIEYLMPILVVVTIIIFLISRSLSGTMSSELENIVTTMTNLADGASNVPIPEVVSGREMTALARGLGVFKQSLRMNYEQKIEFEQNNILLLYEINERKKTMAQLLETRARFQYVLDNSPTIIYSAKPHGDGLRITYVSENTKQIIGIEANELLGDRRLWNNKLSIDGNKILFKEMSELYLHRKIARDYKIINGNGDLMWLHDSLTLTSVNEDQSLEILGSLTNVTEIKVTQERLQKMNGELSSLAASLEDKVKSRTADLEKANLGLQKLSAAKSDFISIVSHDLRTPLTGVKLFTDIMLDDIDNISRETQVEYLSIISSETDRLSRLITNILDFQKISAGKMQWNDEEVDLKSVVEECVRPFRITFESKKVEFNYVCDEDEVITVIDPDRFSQVVYNLLSNAMKFTQSGSVEIKLSRSKTHDGGVISLTVSDTGPGMPAEVLKSIFEPFEQYEGVPNLGKGTGLGLYITQRVSEHYNGLTWVESTLGKGSIFHVDLPVRTQQNYVI